MINLKELLKYSPAIKWIVGYVDSYGSVFYKVIYNGDKLDSHNQLWANAHHGKWRWVPSSPKHLNTYNETIDDDSLDRIWNIINKYI